VSACISKAQLLVQDLPDVIRNNAASAKNVINASFPERVSVTERLAYKRVHCTCGILAHRVSPGEANDSPDEKMLAAWKKRPTAMGLRNSVCGRLRLRVFHTCSATVDATGLNHPRNFATQLAANMLLQRNQATHHRRVTLCGNFYSRFHLPDYC